MMFLNCDSQGQALDSMVKIMNKNVSVGYYDKTESIQISKKKGDEDEKQNSIETRPGKRVTNLNVDLYILESVFSFTYTDVHFQTKTILEDLEKNVVNKYFRTFQRILDLMLKKMYMNRLRGRGERVKTI